MTIIVFSPSVDGHFLEYIHHIYMLCMPQTNNKYIFVVPKKFEERRGLLGWPESTCISFDLFSDEIEQKLYFSSQFSRSINTARFIQDRVKKHRANKVFTTHLIATLPFLPFYLPKKVKVYGIIYMIYLYRLAGSSLIFRLQNWIKYVILSKSSVYDKILILNDKESANTFNLKYRTSKFDSINDPYIPICCSKNDLAKSLGISSDDTVYIHIGAMNTNKGTLEVLESLKNIKQEDATNMYFIFAGKVEDSIKEQFYKQIKAIGDKVRIYIKDEFCSYSYFADLCKVAHAIIIPYRRTSQSSGIIGYASQFGKPVIVPDSGLLGNLARSYKLGVIIKDIKPDSLIDAYVKVKNREYTNPDSCYCRDHTVELFQKKIKEYI